MLLILAEGGPGGRQRVAISSTAVAFIHLQSILIVTLSVRAFH
jgi:hypothetical protein